MIYLVILVTLLIFAIGLLFLVYGTLEENGGAFISGIIFSAASFFLYYYTYNTPYQNEKWLVQYVLDHKCADKIFIGKFNKEIIEIKKDKAFKKIEKEYK